MSTPRWWAGLPPPAQGALAGAVALAAATAFLLPFRSRLDTASAALVLVVPGVVAAVFGGRPMAAATGLTAAVVFNVGFLHPYGTLKIDPADEVIDLVVFSGVALFAASLVAQSADRRRAAEERTAEIEALDRENAAIRGERERITAEAVGLALAADHRNVLLRSVSHDLRTPLATIRAVVSDLREGDVYDRRTSEELLDLVADETERLDRFVSNLLNLSRIEAGALVPERQAVPLDELFADCVRRHRRLVRDRKVSFDVPLTLPLVDADWTLLDQVLTNLIDNAVRHAPAGSRIYVTAQRRGERWVEVSVTDQGPGFPAAGRPEVFQAFRRGPGSRSSGIGLAIVKAVVEAHGGSVAIGEGPDGGARVSFTLPVHGA